MGFPLTLVVVIPVKALHQGKSRLAGALDGGQRQRLCTWMLERTLGLVIGHDRVVVVSDDENVGGLCRRIDPSVRFLFASHPTGLNAALDQARSQIAVGDEMLFLPTDLVRLDRASLYAFLDVRDTIRIAPDAAAKGTNLLFLPGGAVPEFRFAFGADSLRRHRDEARRLGFEPHLHAAPATALDVDVPDDLGMVGPFR